MKEFTQTSLMPAGNCWQTCVACILEVEPAELPDQATNDYVFVDGKWEGKGYNNAIQAYLRDHHGLAYTEIHADNETMEMLRIRDDSVYHLMTGRTVRSDTLGGARHVVVGRGGKVVWDPHPSRAGLTENIRWAFLVPFPKEWDREQSKRINPCICPKCASASALREGQEGKETKSALSGAPASTPGEAPWQNDVRCMQCDVLCPPPPAACACECHLVATPGVPK